LDTHNVPDPEPTFPASTKSYLHKRAVLEPWQLDSPPCHRFKAAVVIPALAEYTNLPFTLRSLSRNPPELLAQTLLLVVVNHCGNSSDAEKSDNRATLAALPVWKAQYGLSTLHWVDAASADTELPPKQGVGLARKIGMDLVLRHLDYNAGDPLLICLDSDTLVQPDYLKAIFDHFALSPAGGASIPYRHRPAETVQGQAAIDRYELFLRTYVLGLKLSGSPYAFHTVGSAMACRSSAYVTSGGMNRRQAGEDFYFLQQLYKTSGVADLAGTIVHPSPRSSLRVPFGTGRAVGDMLADGASRLLFYQPELFGILGKWLGCVAGHGGAGGKEMERRAGRISPWLEEFLQQAGFAATWDNLLQHNRDDARLQSAFHGWFDAFRTMRLMHHLTDRGCPRIEPERAVSPLLEQAGLEFETSSSGMLECLRRWQGV